MPPDQAERRPEPDSCKQVAADADRILSSEDLLAGSREVLIRHGAETYRLRVTRSGKLILHK